MCSSVGNDNLICWTHCGSQCYCSFDAKGAHLPRAAQNNLQLEATRTCRDLFTSNIAYFHISLQGGCGWMTDYSRNWKSKKQIPWHSLSEQHWCLFVWTTVRGWGEHTLKPNKISGIKDTCWVVYFGDLPLNDSLNQLRLNESQMKHHNAKLGRNVNTLRSCW